MLLIYLQISGLNLGLANRYIDGEFGSFIQFLQKLYPNNTYIKLAIPHSTSFIPLHVLFWHFQVRHPHCVISD